MGKKKPQKKAASPQPNKAFPTVLVVFPLTVALVFSLMGLLVWWQMRPGEWQRFTPEVLPPALVEASHFPPADALRCRICHEEEFQEWETSQHAHANRLVDYRKDAQAFNPRRSILSGVLDTEVWQEGRDFLMEQGDPPTIYQAVAVIGVEPLIQYLTPFPGGRLQVFNPAYDPAEKDWFDVFSGEDRQPHDWGFWKNQGMNWNSQCASCHMTSFEKNYDSVKDAYASTWTGMGISCTQCHGDLKEHAANPLAPVRLSERQVFSSCASCHARRGELTGAFRPGQDFDDHYRLVLPDLTDMYFADGQVRDENFETASFLGSKMGHAGVQCLDCHHAHSAKLRLPVENNTMCMSCHTPPGTDGATPIPDPADHSHHPPDSTGNRCVECHMPTTTYMARDPRRDHGFTIPDPLMTKEFGIPNACNACHSDQSVDWALEWVERWYGNKMERPERERTRLIMAARNGEPGITGALVDFFDREPNAAWRASLLLMLMGREADPVVGPLLERSAGDDSPLVRQAAARVAGAGNSAVREKALVDSTRAVRVTMGTDLALAGEDVPPKIRSEVEAYLKNQSDSPLGALQLAQLAAVEKNTEDKEFWLARAVASDPSAGMFQEAAMVHYRSGNLDRAAGLFSRAMEAEPKNAGISYSLALLEAERQRPEEALRLLRRTVDISPEFGRAWYNLGLAQASAADLSGAMDSLEQAARLLPGDPEPPFALATVYLRAGKPSAAKSAAEEALRRNPGFGPARQILLGF